MEEQLHELARNAPRSSPRSSTFPASHSILRRMMSCISPIPRNEFISIDRLRAVTQAPDAPRFPLEDARIVPLMLGMRASGAVAMIEGEYSDGLYDAIGGLLAIALERTAALGAL